MKNPWSALPSSGQFVLPIDAPHVDAFNAHASPNFRLDLGLLPHPFFGNQKAPLVVLGLNPGVGPTSKTDHRDGGRRLRANLTSDDPEDQLHLGFLPEYANTRLGQWWRRSFSAVLNAEKSADTLARKVLAVEFHGYHSVRWRAIPVTLPSQPFGFWLVSQAIRRNATIVVTRGVRYWEVAVPALAGYAGRVNLNNPRSSTLSVGNCGTDGFDRVLTALA